MKEKAQKTQAEQPKISEDTAKKIQELQLLEQNVQGLLLQRQAFQLELNETLAASEELKKVDEAYKIIGNIMLKASKPELEEELKSKKELAEMRLRSLEKQETALKERLFKLRSEIMANLERK